MINMILVAAQHDGISATTQSQMYVSLALFLTHQKAKDELASLALEFRETPIPCLSEGVSSTSRLRERKLGLRGLTTAPVSDGDVPLLPPDNVLNAHL